MKYVETSKDEKGTFSWDMKTCRFGYTVAEKMAGF